jgi:hypothetical protein
MARFYLLGLALLVSFGVGFKVNSVFAEKKLTRELAAQAEKINQECEKAKQTTERLDNEYQSQITKLRADVKRARGMYKSNQCVPIAKTAIGDNATSTADIVRGRDAVPVASLIDYSESAEQVRIQLLGCQDYVKSIGN